MLGNIYIIIISALFLGFLLGKGYLGRRFLFSSTLEIFDFAVTFLGSRFEEEEVRPSFHHLPPSPTL